MLLIQEGTWLFGGPVFPECFQLGILRRLKGQANIDSLLRPLLCSFTIKHIFALASQPLEFKIFKQHIYVLKGQSTSCICLFSRVAPNLADLVKNVYFMGLVSWCEKMAW